MSFRPSPADRPPPTGRAPLRLPRWPRYLIPIVAGLIALGILVTIIAGVWTDFLWYRSVHNMVTGTSYGSVFGVVYGTRWALFFVVGLLMVAVTGLNAVLAYRLRPTYRPARSTPERPGVDLYRAAIDPHRRLILGVVLALIGVISGVTASGAWRTWLLFINQVPFHEKDPQFHLDISFFVFTYPFLRLVLSYLFAAVLLSLLAAVIVHILYGGLGWQARRPRATVGAQVHLFILVGVFVLLTPSGATGRTAGRVPGRPAGWPAPAVPAGPRPPFPLGVQLFFRNGRAVIAVDWRLMGRPFAPQAFLT